MIWFTSDLHLGHRSVINMCEPPFETVEEMHYPIMSWSKSWYGALHLHGHIHSKGDYMYSILQQGANF